MNECKEVTNDQDQVSPDALTEEQLEAVAGGRHHHHRRAYYGAAAYGPAAYAPAYPVVAARYRRRYW